MLFRSEEPLHAVLDPAQLKQLGLPNPEQPPVTPGNFFAAVISRADAELDPDNATIPYPFSKGVPAAPDLYTRWLVAGTPPAVPSPSEDGLVIRYAVGLVEQEAIENQIRAIRTRVEKTRDLLLLMRQQLDSQTVALAALAGGVAGDGGGLQVARWLPYASLDVSETSPTSSAETMAVAQVTTAQPQAAAGLNLNAIKSAVSASSFSTNLFSTAQASTAAKTNLLLTSRPQTFSAFELGINKSRLEQLSRITRAAVAKPAYEAKEYRFGVIDHISPEINEYAKAYYGMKELLATLKDLFDPTDAASLRNQLQKVGRADEADEGPGNQNPFERSSRLDRKSVV